MTCPRPSRYRLAALVLLLLVACKAPAPAAQAEVAAKLPELANKNAASESNEPAIPKLEEHAFPLLVWAAFLVQSEYFDPLRFDLRDQLEQALAELGRHVPEFFGSMTGDVIHVTVGSQKKDFTVPPPAKGFFHGVAVLEEILAFVRDSLHIEGEELHEVEYAAISGLFASLDPHTILLTPKEHAELGVRTRGRFGGVGAVIREAGRGIRIEEVLVGMPAEKAGLHDGDLVLTIDGRSTVDMSASDAQERLRGPEGTSVRLRVQRGRKVIEVKIVRAIIRVPAISFAALPDRVGYFELSTFQEDCAADLSRELQRNQNKWENGIVLDLRRNSGGLLNEATALVDLFVDQGELIAVHSMAGRESQSAAAGTVVPADVPLIVLVDEHSASASEIVAGGLQELGRAVVVGRTTFGKGSVQRVNDAQPYGRELALKMTVAEYRLANERRIQTLGVRPDLELIPVVLSQVPGMALYYDEVAFEEAREHWQSAHLASAKHERDIVDSRPPAALRVRYLDEPIDAAGPASNRMREPEVRLAQELALGFRAAKSSDAHARQAALKELRGTVAQREEERIVEALARDKIDFRGQLDQSQDIALAMSTKVISGPAKHPTTGEPTVPAATQVQAGTSFAVEIAITNRGNQAAQRVHVISKCALEELDRQEFLFGRIEPGATVTRRFELQVDPMRPAVSEPVHFAAYAGEPVGDADGTSECLLNATAVPRPHFAFDWWIVDAPAWAKRSPARPQVDRYRGEAPFVVQGNGDGRLQAGEQALLVVRVHNRSQAEASSAQVVVRNHSSQQALLEEDHHTFGKMAGGAAKLVSFGITVAAAPKENLPLELEVLAADGLTHSGVVHTLRLPVFAQVDPTLDLLAKGEPCAFEGALDLRAEASADAPILGALPAGAGATKLAKYGDWIAIEGSNGQRLWGFAGQSVPVGKTKPPIALQRAMVEPPSLAVQVPLTVMSPTVKLSGTAQDDGAMRDVVVWVAGAQPPQVERKVAYQAQAESAKTPASLTWQAEVPLQPGGNYLRVVARDADKVAAETTYWLRREK